MSIFFRAYATIKGNSSILTNCQLSALAQKSIIQAIFHAATALNVLRDPNQHNPRMCALEHHIGIDVEKLPHAGLLFPRQSLARAVAAQVAARARGRKKLIKEPRIPFVSSRSNMCICYRFRCRRLDVSKSLQLSP